MEGGNRGWGGEAATSTTVTWVRPCGGRGGFMGGLRRVDRHPPRFTPCE